MYKNTQSNHKQSDNKHSTGLYVQYAQKTRYLLCAILKNAQIY